MDARIKELWLKALRSGEYKQATSALRRAGTGYCCLGVLCELHGEETGFDHWQDGQYEGEGEVLPCVVREWAGLSDISPVVWERSGSRAMLAELNDDGATFTELADLIEEQL